ncbi:MAG: redox-sensing transcriptional repressor Rex [Dehalococcoidia bacterium]|nr:redox-sensing transcriptional repressor Rex [Dehalococcoidia bacterium]
MSRPKAAVGHIPDVVIRRLPIYMRALEQLAAQGAPVISSLDLGRQLAITPAQIRKDLSFFGEFGKQGAGYDVTYLLHEIRKILGLDHEWRMAIVGVGRLGRAIASYPGFTAQGFRVVALFDDDPAKIGDTLDGLTIHATSDMPQIIPAEGVTIGIVAVPASQAQRVVDLLVSCGVTALLNYAPISVTAPPTVRIRDVDPVVALQSMTYYLKHYDRLLALAANPSD